MSTDRPGRVPVTVRPMPDAAIAGGVLGLFGGVALAGIVVGIGVPVGPALGGWWNLVFALLWLGGGAALAMLSWRATRLRFEPDRLLVVRPTGRRRSIPWDHVRWVNVETTTSEDGDVVGRYLTLTVLRHPDQPVPEAPTRFGDWRAWHREHFRTVHLGVPFPRTANDARGRWSHLRLRTRRTVIDELEARGFTVPQ